MSRATKVTKNARRVGLSALRHQPESHSLSVMSCFCARIKPSENRHHRRNLCGSPVPFPLWTPERCRLKFHLSAVPADPQLRFGTKRKIVTSLSPDTEFWSGPRQNRHLSKHDCNRVVLAKLFSFPFRQCHGCNSLGKLSRNGSLELYAVGGNYADA